MGRANSCNRSGRNACARAKYTIKKQLAMIARLRSGTIVLVEAVATINSDAVLLTKSVQCMDSLHVPYRAAANGCVLKDFYFVISSELLRTHDSIARLFG